MKIHDHISPQHLGSHLFNAQLTLDGIQDRELELSIARWIPGSYKIRDYARLISNLQISGNSQLTKIDSQTWRLKTDDPTITLSYQVYANDFSVRGCYLDSDYCLINPCAMLFNIKGYEHAPRQLSLTPIQLPHSTLTWPFYTALPYDLEQQCYVAQNYAHLIDSPIVAGQRTEQIEFSVKGHLHRLVLLGDLPSNLPVDQTAENTLDLPRMAADLSLVCHAQHDFFADNPLDDGAGQCYYFLALVGDHAMGGLEHEHSCALMTTPQSLLRQNEGNRHEKYVDFLSLCSHEYFHLYNVKRLRPKIFLQYDLSCEQHTELLWFFEGITNYYDEWFLHKTGLIDEATYLHRFARMASQVLNTPGLAVMSLLESSFDAWTKLYLPDENSHNTQVSYYSKGAMFAFALDCFLQSASSKTQPPVSLQTLMQQLWQQYGKTRLGLDSEAIFTQLYSLLDKVQHQPLTELLKTGLEQVGVLDYSALCAPLGLNWQNSLSELACDIGLDFKVDETRLLISKVRNNVISENSLISVGDAILAVDGRVAEAGELLAMISAHLQTGKAGDVLQLNYTKNHQQHEETHRLMANGQINVGIVRILSD